MKKDQLLLIIGIVLIIICELLLIFNLLDIKVVGGFFVIALILIGVGSSINKKNNG